MSTTSKLPDTTKNISKLYIDKLKREEEEEQWISGEELNTDESSDEDDGARSTRAHRGGARPKAHAQKNKRPSDVPPLAAPPQSTDEPSDISCWKPKRGSIRLPHVITDATSKLPRECNPNMEIDTSKPTCYNNFGD